MKPPQALLLICDMGWSIRDALCMREGKVELQPELVGTMFPDLARDHEVDLKRFMSKLSDGSLASNIELALKHQGREITLHFFGSQERGHFVIVAGADLEEVLLLLVDRTVRADRGRDELLQGFKRTFLLQPRVATNEATVFDEISRLNDELVCRSRELSKRNLELFLEKERNRVTIASIGDAVVATDVRGRITSINALAEELTGWSADDAIGMDVADVVGLRNAKGEAPHGLFSDLLWEGKSAALPANSTLLRRDGTMITVDDSIAPIKGSDGRIIGLVMTFRDVSARMHAENALREVEANFRAFASMTEMVIIGTSDGHILLCNEAVHQTLGYSVDEIKGMHMLDLHPRENRAEAEEIFAAMFRGERDICPLPLVRRDGILVPAETHLWRGQWNGEGCIFGTSRDLSKEAEAQHRFEKLFRNNPSLMAVSTVPEAAFIDVNDAFLNGMGYSKEEVLGKTNLELEMFPDPGQQAALAKQLQMTGRLKDIEIQVRRKDGELLYGLFNGELIDIQGKQYFLTVMVDITERRRALSMLQEERLRLASVLEGTNVGTWEWNAQTGETSFDERWAQIIGYTLAELAPISIKTWEALVHPDDRRKSEDLLEKHFAGKTSHYDCEARMMHKDGHWVWVQDRGRVFSWTREGRPLMMFGTHSDITERMRAHEVVLDAKNKLKATLDSLPDIVFEIDEEERFIAYHEPKEATPYMRREELLDKKLKDVLPPVAIDVIRTAIGEARRTGIGHGSFPITLSQGTAHFEMLMSRKGGATPTFIASVRDVTKRRQLEQQLSESEERYRALVERLPDGIIVHRRGRIVFVNKAAMGLLQIPPDQEVEKRMLMDFFHPEDRSLVLHRMREAQKSERPPTYERLVDLQGHDLDLELSAVPFTDREGGAAMVILHDVSDRKRAEESLQEVNKKLNLLSRITRHDINKQMIRLEGCLSRLEEEGSDLADDSPLLEARAAAKRISALIDFTAEYDDIGIAAASWQTIRASIKMALLLVPLGGVKARNEVPADLEVFADPLILKVFEILVDNALKNDDTITTMRFSLDERDGVSVLICQDDGRGIPEALKEGLFDRDFDEGRGLGLFLCREILAITGITIMEDGRSGHGARFIMTVPSKGLRRAKKELVEGLPR